MSDPILGATVKFEGDDSGLQRILAKIAADVARAATAAGEVSTIKISANTDEVLAGLAALTPEIRKQVEDFRALQDAIKNTGSTGAQLDLLKAALAGFPADIKKISAELSPVKANAEAAASGILVQVSATGKLVTVENELAKARARIQEVIVSGDLAKEDAVQKNKAADALERQLRLAVAVSDAEKEQVRIEKEHAAAIEKAAAAYASLRFEIGKVNAERTRQTAAAGEFNPGTLSFGPNPQVDRVSISRAVSDMQALGGAIGPVTNNFAKMNLSAAELANHSRRVADHFSGQIVQGLEQSVQNMLGFATAAGATVVAVDLIVSGMKSVVSNTFEAAESAKKLTALSNIEGIDVEKLQSVSLAAKLAGSNLISVKVGISTLERSIQSAEEGSKHYAEALAKIGFRAEEFKGMNSADQFEKVAGAIARLNTQNEKALITQVLFGRGGRELLPIIKEYGDLVRQAAKNGTIVSEKDIENARRLANAGDIASEKFKKFFTEIAAGVATTTDSLARLEGKTVLGLGGDSLTQLEEADKKIKGIANEIENFPGVIRIIFDDSIETQAKQIETILKGIADQRERMNNKDDSGLSASISAIESSARKAQDAARDELQTKLDAIAQEAEATRQAEQQKRQNARGEISMAIKQETSASEIESTNRRIKDANELIRISREVEQASDEAANKRKQFALEEFKSFKDRSRAAAQEAIDQATITTSVIERGKAVAAIDKAIEGLSKKSQTPIQIVVETIQKQGKKAGIEDELIKEAIARATVADKVNSEISLQSFLTSEHEKAIETTLRLTQSEEELAIQRAKAKAEALGLGPVISAQAEAQIRADEQIKASTKDKIEAEKTIKRMKDEMAQEVEANARKEAELAKSIIAGSRTEAEVRADKIKEINRLQGEGLLTQQQATKAQQALNEKLKETQILSNAAQTYAENQKNLFNSFEQFGKGGQPFIQIPDQAAQPAGGPKAIPDIKAPAVGDLRDIVANSMSVLTKIQIDALGVLREILDATKANKPTAPAYG